MAEKTEKATPRKLREARKKGQVAKSQDFPSAFTFATSIFLVLTLSKWLWGQIMALFANVCQLIPSIDWQAQGGQLMDHAFQLILQITLPFAGITAIVGSIVTFLVIGPTWATKGMKFDLKKLDPIKGLRNKFKIKTLVELIKSLLKISIAGAIIYYVIRGEIGTIIDCAAIPPLGSALVVATLLKKVVLYVGIFYIAVAVADLAFQKKQFAKEMMMEKFEVKQESKDTEGNPEIKNKRRQIAQEIAYDEGPSAVKRAKAVVTNPTHIAVGIGYDPEKNPAPYIVLMGTGPRAEMIIKAAEENGVAVVYDPDLAHELFEAGSANRYVPEETYQAVAEVLRWVMKMEFEQGKEPPKV